MACLPYVIVMLNRDALFSHKTFQTAEQIEKDYLQHLVLKGLSEKIGSGVVFKGGTALQKIYGLDRFSEDLDFSIGAGDAMVEVDDGIDNASNFCEIVNNVDEDRTTARGLATFRLMVRGPATIQSIRVDVVEEQTVIKTRAHIVKPVYGDPQPYILHVMDEREILAEKVRAIVSRNATKARDLYDLHFLLSKGIGVDPGLIALKFKFIKRRFSVKEFGESVDNIQPVWDSIGAYVRSPPSYSDVKRDVMEKFASMIWI